MLNQRRRARWPLNKIHSAQSAPADQGCIACSYQIANILPNATTLENVRVAVQSRAHSWSMLSHYSSYRDIIVSAESVLEAVGLRAKENELAGNLSHGEQRNLEIGIALAT